MSQLNIHLTPKFEKQLRRLMRIRRLRSKSEAVRLAVEEALERSAASQVKVDFTEWVGRARQAPENPSPRFASHDQLWEP